MPRRATISLFLLIISGLLYVANLVVYEAALLAFGITQTWQALALSIGLGLLSASFIAATILGNWYYNWLTRWYYTFAAVWVGLLVYLFMASAIFGFIIAVSQTCYTAGTVLFIIAALLSSYGIIHARKIVIEKVTVSMRNLPPSWAGKKAVWISDLHLGQIHGRGFAQKVVARVCALSPDVIFIGGDLYDGTGAPDIPELTSPLRELSAPKGVYFVTGNHEEYGNRKQFLDAVRMAGARVLDDEMVEIDGLQIVGVDYQTASDSGRFKEILSTLAIDPKKASILLKHEPKDLDIAQGAGISFQISGHTHKAQLWPLEYIAKLAYKGFSYGLKRFHEMQVYVSSGTGTWGPPMRVGTNSEIVLFTLS